MIGCLRTQVRKQPIIALNFELETVLKFYNLDASPLETFIDFSMYPGDFLMLHKRLKLVLRKNLHKTMVNKVLQNK